MSATEAPSAGATVWLTGLPSAGKTTLAHAVTGRLPGPAEVLDGDELRAVLSPELGHSRADRALNVSRIGYLARLLARNGITAVVAVVSPFADARLKVRAEHAAEGVPFVEVHVATPLRICRERDVKGLYERWRTGDVRELTGVDSPYEPPEDPELWLDTTGRSLSSCAGEVCAALADRVRR
ncbi:adenylyl-sulfate kinase [Amycolatopsis thailandensis]|uniref:adenylyl-sulfate kinase n=1 Tax=Amycolatopsis thailandensis TaxID=589330 RepID=UPI0037A744E7